MNDHAVDRARRLLEGFGAEIQLAREEHKVTIRQMSEDLDENYWPISPPDLSRIERGILVASPTQLSGLRDWLLQHPVSDEMSEEQGECVQGKYDNHDDHDQLE